MSQQKEEEAIWCQNQIIALQSFFTANLLAIEMKKAQICMNKRVYLGFSIPRLSKILIYEFVYVKPKYGEKSNLCYMDTHSFIVRIKIDNIYKEI